jgi:leucyl-tRNA synthetase
VEIAVQINGKVKSRITVPVDADERQVEQLARADETVGNAIADKTVRRVIVRGGRIVNFVLG